MLCAKPPSKWRSDIRAQKLQGSRAVERSRNYEADSTGHIETQRPYLFDAPLRYYLSKLAAGRGRMSIYDYLIIAFYFAFILIVGLVFRRLSKNTSDYFRCGGAMPWWITGVSAWIATFSAWTFTGAAGKIYETGTLVLGMYYGTIPALLIVLFFTCYRFRRMRVVTWMEGVRHRYGRGTEQFYTWIKLPLLLIFSGVGLNAVGVFMSSVFHQPMAATLILLGSIVTIVALVGGAWAVLASDFVQMLLVMTITIVAAYLALRQPAIGGLHGLVQKVPHSFFHWSDLAAWQVVWLWVIAQLALKLFDYNNMESSSMYLMVKSDRDARRMVLIPLIGTLVGPMIWIIPPMVARITHPHLDLEYAGLVQPSEAAFVAVCRDVMPQGLIALLVCSMFGATLTSMDAGLNKGVGVFVRNFYKPLIDPECSEKKLLVIGKICTAVFGAIIVGNALVVNRYRSSGLFDLTNQLAASLGLPLMIPLFLGLFFKRTPGWSGWSTGLVGFASSWIIKFYVSAEWCMRQVGVDGPLSDREKTDFLLFATVLTTLVVCTTWFFGSSFFYRSSSVIHRERVARFFEHLRTPIDSVAENLENYDGIMYRMIGTLCEVYGAFVLLLTAIPNSLRGRACFIFCGGVIFGMGFILRTLGRRSGSTIAPSPAPLHTDGSPLNDLGYEDLPTESEAGGFPVQPGAR
jgi:SSS family solute:Na+ symporter